MEGHDHSEHSADKSKLCRLEWIAWAIEAARRHKDDERRSPAASRTLLETDDD